jgi:hypothetical protein
MPNTGPLDDPTVSESKFELAPDAIEHRALSVLLPRVLASCLLAVAIGALLRGKTGVHDLAYTNLARSMVAKRWDHLIYGVSLIGAAILVALVARSRRQRTALTIGSAIIAAALLDFGIGWIEQPNLVKSSGFWSGFGVSALIFVVLATPVIWKLLEWKTLPRAVRIPISLAAAAITITDGIAMYRPIYQVAGPSNNAYMLDEMLAQAAGKVPDSDFMPLYEHMYGWVLKPFAHHLDVTTLTAMACVIFAACSMAAVALGVLVAHRALDRRSLTMAVLLVVPITCVTTSHNPLINLAGAFQDIPIRLFPGMLMGALGVEELLRVRRGEIRVWRIAVVGAVAGLVAWSNHDFAVESVVVFGGLLLLSSGRRFSGWKPMVYFCAGFLGVTLGYPGIMALTGNPISLRELFYFQSLFGHGFGEYPVQIPGPVMFVMPLIVGTAAVGVYAIWKRRGEGNEARALATYEERAALTAAFFGVWSVVAFTYYLNRSISAGQLQIFLLPSGVSVSALAAMGIRPVSAIWSRFGREETPEEKSQIFASLCGIVPLTMLCAVPLASSLQTPNPVRAVKVLVSPPRGTKFAWPPVTVLGKELMAFEKKNPKYRDAVSYFGPWGNYVTLSLGIPTVTLNDVPPSDGTGVNSLGCGYIRSHQTKALVLDSGTIYFYGPTVCNLYHLTQVQALAPWSLYIHN